MKTKIFTYSNEKLINTAILVVRMALGIIMFAMGRKKCSAYLAGRDSM